MTGGDLVRRAGKMNTVCNVTRRAGTRLKPVLDRPKRRRSPSPQYPSHRPRQRSPSPPPPSRPSHGLPDPAEVELLISFKQFAEWFRVSHPQTARVDEDEVRKSREAGVPIGKEKIGMSKRYERYMKEYTSRQLYALYLTHRESAWFLERYSQDEAFVSLRRRVNRQGRVPTAEKYLDALRAGEYDNVDFDLTGGLSMDSFQATPLTLSIESEEKGKPSRRLSQNDAPEGLDRALEDIQSIPDDPLRIEVAPAERQVFVKTVPPSTGRQELEDLFDQVDKFDYLALTEPFPKKAFHRVAWAQFGEGVDPLDVVKRLDESRVSSDLQLGFSNRV